MRKSVVFGKKNMKEIIRLFKIFLKQNPYLKSCNKKILIIGFLKSQRHGDIILSPDGKGYFVSEVTGVIIP